MSRQDSGLVWGAILPHGPDTVLEITADPALMAETRTALEEAGRRFAAARIDTVVLIDPFLVHTQNSFDRRALYCGAGELLLGTAAYAGGSLGNGSERFECDMKLVQTILQSGRADGFPVARDSGENGEQRLHGGALIPLWFTLRPLPAPRPQLVVIAPSPAVPRAELVRFGGLLAQVAAESGKRVALIASADQGHTHDPKHPRFGYSLAAAQFDALYCEAVVNNRLKRLLDVGDEMLIASWADSLWQTLVLAGALDAAPMRVELLSYAVPSYYGMAVAVYEP